jgi:hypothetical protein
MFYFHDFRDLFGFGSQTSISYSGEIVLPEKWKITIDPGMEHATTTVYSTVSFPQFFLLILSSSSSPPNSCHLS